MADPNFEVHERRRVIIEYEIKAPPSPSVPVADQSMRAAVAALAEVAQLRRDIPTLVLETVSRQMRRSGGV